MKTDNNHSEDLKFINETLEDLKKNIKNIDFASYKQYEMDKRPWYSPYFSPIIQEFKIGKNSYRIEKAKNKGYNVFTYQIVINGDKDKAIQLYEEDKGNYLRDGSKQIQDPSATEIFKKFKNCLEGIHKKISNDIDTRSNCTIDRDNPEYKPEQHTIREDFRERYKKTSYTNNNDGTFNVKIGDNEYTTAFMHFQPTYDKLYINDDYSWKQLDDIPECEENKVHKKKSATMFSSNNKKNIFTSIHSTQPFSVAMMFGPENDIYDYSEDDTYFAVKKQQDLIGKMGANYKVHQRHDDRTLYFKMANDALKKIKKIDKFKALFANTECRGKKLFSIEDLYEEQKNIQTKKDNMQDKEKELLDKKKSIEEYLKKNKDKAKNQSDCFLYGYNLQVLPIRKKEIESLPKEKEQIEIDKKAIESAIDNVKNNKILNSGAYFDGDEALMITKNGKRDFNIANFCIQFNFYNEGCFNYFREIYKINKKEPSVKWDNIKEDIEKIVKHNKKLGNKDLWILDYGNQPNTFFKIPNDVKEVEAYYNYRYDLVERERTEQKKILEPFDPKKNSKIQDIIKKQPQQNDSKNIIKIDNKIDNEQVKKEKFIIDEKNKSKNIENINEDKVKEEIAPKIDEAIKRIKQKINSVNIDDNKLFIISGEHGYNVFSEFLTDPENKQTINLALNDIRQIKKDKQLGFLIPENTFKPEELEDLFTSAENIRNFLKDEKQDTYKKEILLYNLATIAQNLKGTKTFFPEQVGKEEENCYVSRGDKMKKYIVDFLAHSQYFVTLFPKTKIYMKDTDRGKQYDEKDKKDGKKNGENKLTKEYVEGDIVDLNNFLDRGVISFRKKYELSLIDHYISNCEAIMMIAYKRAKELAAKSKDGKKVPKKIDIIYPNVGAFAHKDKIKRDEHRAIIDLIYQTYAEKLNNVLKDEGISIDINVAEMRDIKKKSYSFEENKEEKSFIYINAGDPFVHIGAEALVCVKYGMHSAFQSSDTYMTLTTSLDMLGCKNENEDKLVQLKGFYYVDKNLEKNIKLDPQTCKFFCITENALSVDKKEEKAQQQKAKKKIKKLKLKQIKEEDENKEEEKKEVKSSKSKEECYIEECYVKEEPKQKVAQQEKINKLNKLKLKIIKKDEKKDKEKEKIIIDAGKKEHENKEKQINIVFNKFKPENKTNNLEELIKYLNTKKETGKKINLNNLNSNLNSTKIGFNKNMKSDNTTGFPKIIPNNNIDPNNKNSKLIINDNVNNFGKTKLKFYQSNKNQNINKLHETGNKVYLPNINDKNYDNSSKKFNEIIISKDNKNFGKSKMNFFKKNYNGNININKFNNIFSLNNQFKLWNNNNIQSNNLGKSKMNFFKNHNVNKNIYSNNQKSGNNNYSKITKFVPMKNQYQ